VEATRHLSFEGGVQTSLALSCQLPVLEFDYADLQSNAPDLKLEYPLNGAKCRNRHFALAV
jgi:hypothetical protein